MGMLIEIGNRLMLKYVPVGTYVHNVEIKPAAQIGAGFTYQLQGNMALDIGYRYKIVTNVDFDDNNGGGVYTGATIGSHNLQAGLSWSF